MQIYSTVFPIKGTLSKETFVQLIIDWNQGSPHTRIGNLHLDGSKNIKTEEGNLSLSIEELEAHNIIAARFRQVDQNNIIWTTDFIANFNDKKLAIRLDREATQETKRFTPSFKPPVFVNMILNQGYADTDVDLEITDQPIEINKKNYHIIESIILRRVKYCLPVVYVTKTWAGRFPLHTERLAYRLRGVAHVLKETDADVSFILRDNCFGENVHHGGVGIYYPNTAVASKKINTMRYAQLESDLEDKIVNTICRYMNQQAKDKMYTWEGVKFELLRLKNEALLSRSKAAETEKNDLYDTFNESIREQTKEIESLNNRIIALAQENQGLHAKLDGMSEVPLLFLGEEDELYEGEIREIILDIMNEHLKTVQANSRRYHVLRDILSNNRFNKVSERKRNTIKKMLKGYTKANDSLLQEMKNFGFNVTSEKNHYKLAYYKDHRYVVTMAKTGSDSQHGGNNLAQIIIKMML